MWCNQLAARLAALLLSLPREQAPPPAAPHHSGLTAAPPTATAARAAAAAVLQHARRLLLPWLTAGDERFASEGFRSCAHPQSRKDAEESWPEASEFVGMSAAGEGGAAHGSAQCSGVSWPGTQELEAAELVASDTYVAAPPIGSDFSRR